ncbi:MAG: MbnP family protein [Flavobacteriales bacterium]
MKTMLLFFFLCLAEITYAQSKTITIRFLPVYEGKELALYRKYAFLEDSVEFSCLKFYVSHIQLAFEDGSTEDVQERFRLVDLEKPSSCEITHLSKKSAKIRSLRFGLGVDSLTSSSGAMGGDLDPVHGMYWTWQSGYIHVKLEGTTKYAACRNGHFRFHLGGYRYPFNSWCERVLPASDADTLTVQLDIAPFIKGADLVHSCEVMSPGARAMDLVQLLLPQFTLRP